MTKLAGNHIFNIGKIGFTNSENLADASNGIYKISEMQLENIVNIFKLNLGNPFFIIGLLLGVLISALFFALILIAIEKSTNRTLAGIREQFLSIKELWEGTKLPDYGNCIKTGLKTAQKFMILPTILALCAPLIVVYFIGIAGITGLFLGALATSLLLSLSLTYTASFWEFKGEVISANLGRAFRDAASMSINIFIKLMIIVAIIFGGITLQLSAYSLFFVS